MLLPSETTFSPQSVTIIGISGISGAGKTTMVKKLGETLKATTLFWDDYDAISQAPDDYVAWYHSDRHNFDAWHYEALEHTLENLKSGKSQLCPATQRQLDPTPYIIFDAPLGYCHQATGKFIDFLVFLNTPPDIALARRLLRDAAHQNILEELDYYLRASRPVYLASYEKKENSDLIVDGGLTVQEQEKLVLNALLAKKAQVNQNAEPFAKRENLRQVTRIGVYGVVVQNQNILLIKKKSGCYQGLLDLPGGGMEFGETPEETLRRELKEEVAMAFEQMKWLANLSHCQQVLDVDDPFSFHHIGQIYRIVGEVHLPDIEPEEQFEWHALHGLNFQKLTPLASKAIEALNNTQAC